MGLAAWAQATAEVLLARQLPRRWRHVRAVAAKADGLRPLYGPEDGEILCAAAWLHDIGYSAEVAMTGFHPLDGARHLRDVGAVPALCALVAHHSGAIHEARLRGLADELSEFVDERTSVRDALWFCDMTTGPDGQDLTFDGRLAEIRSRYGPDHLVAQAITAASGDIWAAVASVESRRGQSTCG
jgi:hypothetical protein